jgi:hypothetical protein
MTDKRHLEVELNHSRQTLQVLQQQPGALAGQPVLTLQEQSALLNTLEQREAELQDTQQQASYKDALVAHLACVLQQVREAAEAAADTEDPSEGAQERFSLHYSCRSVWLCSAGLTCS